MCIYVPMFLPAGRQVWFKIIERSSDKKSVSAKYLLMQIFNGAVGERIFEHHQF